MGGVAMVSAVCAMIAGGMACGPDESLPPASPDRDLVHVAVSIPPQAYFVRRVGGGHVTVTVLLPPGRSPATYEPSPRLLAALERADVYFRIGVPFEARLVEKAAAIYPKLPIVDISQDIPRRRMREAHEHEERSGVSPPHLDAAGRVPADPHVWLDPNNVRVMARTIHRTLCKLAPAHRKNFDRNLAAFDAELRELDGRIRHLLKGCRGKALFVFHPAYGYLADRYGLIQVAVEPAGKSPGSRTLASLLERIRRAGARVIFVQPQFSRRRAETIARAVGARIDELDPLAEDYAENMVRMAGKISQALCPPASRPASQIGPSAIRIRPARGDAP